MTSACTYRAHPSSVQLSNESTEFFGHAFQHACDVQQLATYTINRLESQPWGFPDGTCKHYENAGTKDNYHVDPRMQEGHLARNHAPQIYFGPSMSNR